MAQRPKIGVGVFIFKNGAFLMGKRQNAHGHNTWSVPGGHLEFDETWIETAVREVQEEVGLEIANVRLGAITNDIFQQEGKHYVTIWMLSNWKSGVAQILEPHKFIKLEWCSFDNLPRPLFLPWNQLLQSEWIDKIKKAAK